VLHGSSGVGDDDLRRAIDAGMTKINMSTHLNKTMSAVVRDYLAEHPDTADPRKYLGPARAAMSAEAERLLHVLRAA
jgi:fructose-bisphosphate aldolase class II